jgi:hypothetical protein
MDAGLAPEVGLDAAGTRKPKPDAFLVVQAIAHFLYRVSYLSSHFLFWKID